LISKIEDKRKIWSHIKPMVV